MKARQSRQRGFSLAEMMVSMTIMLIIIVAIFSIIVAEQATHLTEGRKLDMNQGARIIEQMFSEGFRSAGAVLSLANTPVMLGATTLPFNGIYPLNHTDYPDGVILAAGDPLALNRLTLDFTPGDTAVDLPTVNLPDGSAVAWHEGDFGLIMRNDGYYVFRVDRDPALNDTALTVRDTSVYYSGLLNIPASGTFPGYNDQCDEQLGVMGNVNDYPAGSPVVRLDFFNIFLVRPEADGSRTLTLSVDCEDVPDIFAGAITATRGTPILPNVQDIQIEYVAKVIPPAAVANVWAGSDGAFPGSGTNFYNLFYSKNVASARIYVLLRTEEERNKKAGSGITYAKPAMGDVAASTLPVGRFHYAYMQYQVFVRNYNL
jgi:prepilin-type N-terminal cleavage/methylation domain-containing protein